MNLNKYYRNSFAPTDSSSFMAPLPNLKTKTGGKEKGNTKRREREKEPLVISLLAFLAVTIAHHIYSDSDPTPCSSSPACEVATPLVRPLGCPLSRAGHAVLPHHDLGAVGGDPLQLSSVFK
uniref:Uncharacterized protein n=1 Tax=Zea mays TaxID=4577 RepID=C0PM97_MAIZE|nr:unknown [Zea mays]